MTCFAINSLNINIVRQVSCYSEILVSKTTLLAYHYIPWSHDSIRRGIDIKMMILIVGVLKYDEFDKHEETMICVQRCC